MQKYFNIFLEFNHTRLHEIINNAIADKVGCYVCVVDANVLTIAKRDADYRSILNSSIVNTCDGSSIAVMAGRIHKTKFSALNGPEIFELYIEKPFTQVLLGSTQAVLEKIKLVLQTKRIKNSCLHSIPLPFKSVEEFDYLEIANQLNSLKPDIIWVSLGAPKQERFMSRLLPFIDRGVMMGIGAAFNFYIGDLYVPKIQFGQLRFIWLNRLINEPRKISKRLLPYFFAIPRLYWDEKKRQRIIRK